MAVDMLSDGVAPATSPQAQTLDELASRLEQQALEKRGGKSVKEMTTDRKGSGISKFADNIADVISNTPPLDLLAKKVREGKDAAIQAIEDAIDSIQEEFEDMFEEEIEQTTAKQAAAEVVEATPPAAGGDDGASASALANSLKTYILIQKAEIVAQLTALTNAATTIGSALANQVSALNSIKAEINAIPVTPV